MAHDVFISHAAEDKEVAEEVCRALEGEGVGCWVAPRDIPPGRDYEEAIVEAIGASRVLVLILSSHANGSQHVKREVQHAFAEGSPTRVIPFRIEPVNYSKSLGYYLASVQWIDAAPPPPEGHVPRLVRHVRATLAQPGGGEADMHHARPAPRPVMRTGLWAGVVIAAALLLAAVAGYFAFYPRERRVREQPNANLNSPTPTPARATPTPAPTPQPSPTASPTPRPTRPPIRNLNLRLPANLRHINANITRPRP